MSRFENKIIVVTGGSEGIRFGGARGYAAGQGVLDQPYDEAMLQRKNKLANLKAGADIENEDNNNKVKAFRDILEYQARQAESERKTKLDESTIGLNNARAGSLLHPRTTPNYFTRGTDGHRIAVTQNPDGTFAQVDLGQADQTPQERLANQKDLARYSSGLSYGRQKNLFDYTNPITNRQANERQQAGIKATNDRAKDNQNFQRSQSLNNPNTDYARQALAAQNVKINNPKLASSFDVNNVPRTPEAKDAFMREYDALVKKASAGISGIAPQEDEDVVILKPGVDY